MSTTAFIIITGPISMTSSPHFLSICPPLHARATPCTEGCNALFPSGQSTQRIHAPVASCRQSLATWFSVGLLQLQPIHWESSSAALLEKVMAYEAVHPIQGWQDLKQRLGPMRRCPALLFGFLRRANKGPFLFTHRTKCVKSCSVCRQLNCMSHSCTQAYLPRLRLDFSAEEQLVDALLHSIAVTGYAIRKHYDSFSCCSRPSPK